MLKVVMILERRHLATSASQNVPGKVGVFLCIFKNKIKIMGCLLWVWFCTLCVAATVVANAEKNSVFKIKILAEK